MKKFMLFMALALLLPFKILAQQKTAKDGNIYFANIPDQANIRGTAIRAQYVDDVEAAVCDGKKISIGTGPNQNLKNHNSSLLVQECHRTDDNRVIYKALGFEDTDDNNKFYSLSKPQAETEAGVTVPCEDCKRKKSIENFVKENTPIVKKAEQSSKKTNGQPAVRFLIPLNQECLDHFINLDGAVGDLGQHWISRMKEHGFAQYPLFGPSDEKRFCPRYNSMSDDEKYKAYLYMFMILGNKESSCDPGAISPLCFKDKDGNCPPLNPNGRGLGIYQMDGRASILKTRDGACQKPMLYAKGRADEHEFSRTRNKDEAARNNINCAATIADNLLKEGNGILGSKNNYWGPFKGRIPVIMNDLKTYKPCFEGAK